MAELFKLAVIGDPHVAVPHGTDDTRLEIDPGRKLHGLSLELLNATIAAVNAEPDVSAALVLGDLTRDSESFNHEVAREALGRLAMPCYIVLGNHDLKRQRPASVMYPGVEYFDRQQTADFYRDAGFPAAMTRYAVELPGNVVLIVLDTNRSLAELAMAGETPAAQEDGWVGDVQLRWLSDVLTQVTAAGRLPLVAMHHALLVQSPAETPGHILYTAFRNWSLRDAAGALEVLQRFNVPLVLSGHLHAQSVNSADGVCNLITAAAVSYPHAWRMITYDGGALQIESRLIDAIPTCPSLQEQSRQWMAEGMTKLIASRVAGVPGLNSFTSELCDFVIASGWWPRFCDGTLAGFSLDPAGLPAGNNIKRMVFSQIAYTLNEYGRWKAARPDPNTLEIPVGTVKL